jgi:hypothetical protein
VIPAAVGLDGRLQEAVDLMLVADHELDHSTSAVGSIMLSGFLMDQAR